MGLTYAYLLIAPKRNSKKQARVRFLIDSGADYSVVPQEELLQLGIHPHRQVEVSLADGSVYNRQAGDAYFEYQGESAPSPVIFGEEGDTPLLGAVTLETLGFLLDPLKRRILKRKAIRM